MKNSKDYIFQKKIGKVHDYDEITGIIVSNDVNYEFSYVELDEVINNGDIVSFSINNGHVSDIKKYDKNF